MKPKLIIFDMDGTLYDLNDVVQMSYEMQVEYLSVKKEISRDEAISFLAENHVYPVMKKDSKSATELFLQLGFDKKEWSDYRDKGFNVDKINKDNAVKEEVLRRFSKTATIVLLSSNAFSVIEKVLMHIGISTSIFDAIICSDRFPLMESFCKIKAMDYIAKKYNLPYKEMVSIGDRYETDIKPIVILGGFGILINSPSSLNEVYRDMIDNNLGESNAYTLYV